MIAAHNVTPAKKKELKSSGITNLYKISITYVLVSELKQNSINRTSMVFLLRGLSFSAIR